MPLGSSSNKNKSVSPITIINKPVVTKHEKASNNSKYKRSLPNLPTTPTI